MLKINTFYSLILLAVSIISLGISVWIVYMLDPETSIGSILAFYCASGLFVLSLVALILYYLRQRFGVRELANKHFKVSVRQGAWVALLFGLGLFMQSKGLFTWLNSIFLILALIFLESYFIYNERKSSTT